MSANKAESSVKVCGNFEPQAWRKSICKNCFQAPEKHTDGAKPNDEPGFKVKGKENKPAVGKDKTPDRGMRALSNERPGDKSKPLHPVGQTPGLGINKMTLGSGKDSGRKGPTDSDNEASKSSSASSLKDKYEQMERDKFKPKKELSPQKSASVLSNMADKYEQLDAKAKSTEIKKAKSPVPPPVLPKQKLSNVSKTNKSSDRVKTYLKDDIDTNSLKHKAGDSFKSKFGSAENLSQLDKSNKLVVGNKSKFGSAENINSRKFEKMNDEKKMPFHSKFTNKSPDDKGKTDIKFQTKESKEKDAKFGGEKPKLVPNIASKDKLDKHNVADNHGRAKLDTKTKTGLTLDVSGKGNMLDEKSQFERHNLISPSLDKDKKPDYKAKFEKPLLKSHITDSDTKIVIDSKSATSDVKRTLSDKSVKSPRIEPDIKPDYKSKFEKPSLKSHTNDMDTQKDKKLTTGTIDTPVKRSDENLKSPHIDKDAKTDYKAKFEKPVLKSHVKETDKKLDNKVKHVEKALITTGKDVKSTSDLKESKAVPKVSVDTSRSKPHVVDKEIKHTSKDTFVKEKLKLTHDDKNIQSSTIEREVKPVIDEKFDKHLLKSHTQETDKILDNKDVKLISIDTIKSSGEEKPLQHVSKVNTDIHTKIHEDNNQDTSVKDAFKLPPASADAEMKSGNESKSDERNVHAQDSDKKLLNTDKLEKKDTINYDVKDILQKQDVKPQTAHPEKTANELGHGKLDVLSPTTEGEKDIQSKADEKPTQLLMFNNSGTAITNESDNVPLLEQSESGVLSPTVPNKAETVSSQHQNDVSCNKAEHKSTLEIKSDSAISKYTDSNATSTTRGPELSQSSEHDNESLEVQSRNRDTNASHTETLTGDVAGDKCDFVDSDNISKELQNSDKLKNDTVTSSDSDSSSQITGLQPDSTKSKSGINIHLNKTFSSTAESDKRADSSNKFDRLGLQLNTVIDKPKDVNEKPLLTPSHTDDKTVEAKVVDTHTDVNEKSQLTSSKTDDKIPDVKTKLQLTELKLVEEPTLKLTKEDIDYNIKQTHTQSTTAIIKQADTPSTTDLVKSPTDGCSHDQDIVNLISAADKLNNKHDKPVDIEKSGSGNKFEKPQLKSHKLDESSKRDSLINKGNADSNADISKKPFAYPKLKSSDVSEAKPGLKLEHKSTFEKPQLKSSQVDKNVDSKSKFQKPELKSSKPDDKKSDIRNKLQKPELNTSKVEDTKPGSKFKLSKPVLPASKSEEKKSGDKTPFWKANIKTTKDVEKDETSVSKNKFEKPILKSLKPDDVKMDAKNKFELPGRKSSLSDDRTACVKQQTFEKPHLKPSQSVEKTTDKHSKFDKPQLKSSQFVDKTTDKHSKFEKPQLQSSQSVDKTTDKQSKFEKPQLKSSQSIEKSTGKHSNFETPQLKPTIESDKKSEFSNKLDRLGIKLNKVDDKLKDVKEKPLVTLAHTDDKKGHVKSKFQLPELKSSKDSVADSKSSISEHNLQIKSPPCDTKLNFKPEDTYIDPNIENELNELKATSIKQSACVVGEIGLQDSQLIPPVSSVADVNFGNVSAGNDEASAGINSDACAVSSTGDESPMHVDTQVFTSSRNKTAGVSSTDDKSYLFTQPQAGFSDAHLSPDLSKPSEEENSVNKNGSTLPTTTDAPETEKASEIIDNNIERLKSELQKMAEKCQQLEAEKASLTQVINKKEMEEIDLRRQKDEVETTIRDIHGQLQSMEDRCVKLGSENTTLLGNIRDQQEKNNEHPETETIDTSLQERQDVWEEMIEENETLKEEIQELKMEMEEMYDSFRDQEAEEFREIQKELEITAKNCRILQFRMRKAERRNEQIEVERNQFEDKLTRLQNQFDNKDAVSHIRSLEVELKMAKDVSVRLHDELDMLDSKRGKVEEENRHLTDILEQADRKQFRLELEVDKLRDQVVDLRSQVRAKSDGSEPGERKLNCAEFLALHREVI